MEKLVLDLEVWLARKCSCETIPEQHLLVAYQVGFPEERGEQEKREGMSQGRPV